MTGVLKPKVSLQIIDDEVVLTFSRSGVCITACSLSRHFRCLSKTFKNIVASFRGIRNTNRENALFFLLFKFFFYDNIQHCEDASAVNIVTLPNTPAKVTKDDCNVFNHTGLVLVLTVTVFNCKVVSTSS